MSMSCTIQFPLTGSRVSPAYGARPEIVLHAEANDEDGQGAVQSFKDECDINNIMRKFQRTGMLDWINTYDGEFADVTGITFEASMNTILKAQEMFDDLPSTVRDRFANNPALFFDFVHDPKNLDELRNLGLAKPAPLAPAVPATPAA